MPDPHHDRTPARLPDKGMSLPQTRGALDTRLEPLLKETGIQNYALAVAYKGELILVRGKASAPRVLCSLGKPLTAQACRVLVQAGKLRLDVPLKTYLPVSGAASRITARQLLDHQSGLPATHTELAKDLVPPRFEYDLVLHALTQPLRFAPGEGMLYSSLGYQVLGRVIEAVSGQRADQYLKSAVLAPLGVKSYCAATYLSPTDLKTWGDPRLTAWSEVAWGHNDMAGASLMSALDYLRFLVFCRTRTATERLGWQERPTGLTHTGVWTNETHLAGLWRNGSASVCLIESKDDTACARVHALIEDHCLALQSPTPELTWRSVGGGGG